MLVPLALAIVMLVGCKQPTGLPNYDVHVAVTAETLCIAGSNTNMTGWVSKSMDGQTPNGWYADTFGNIKRQYHLENGFVHPKSYGFCVFSVPHFSSPGGVPVCTLYYHQASHSGSLNLVFNYLSGITSWVPSAEVLWKAVDTSSYPLAPTQSVQSNGWCKLALSAGGSGIIADIAQGAPDEGATLPTGWKYTNPSNSDSTIVDGNADTDVSPYIKVVYYPNP